MKRLLCISSLIFVLALSLQSRAQSGTCAGMTLGQNSSLNGFVPFPSSDPWNQNVTTATVDPNSANIIAFIGTPLPFILTLVSDK